MVSLLLEQNRKINGLLQCFLQGYFPMFHRLIKIPKSSPLAFNVFVLNPNMGKELLKLFSAQL